MPTYIATGKDLTLSIDGTDISPQATTAELSYENKIDTYQVLTGTVKKATQKDGSITVAMFQDWGAMDSFSAALWDAAQAGTAVAFSFNADGTVFTGNVIPQFPKVGGGAGAALESSITFPITGEVTRA